MKKKGKITIEGSVHDDLAVKNIIVFNDQDKIHYEKFTLTSNDKNQRDFSVSIPLHKNSNLISIVAEDNHGLTTRKQWVIWKQE